MVALSLLLLSISLATGFDYYNRCLLYNKACVSFCPKLMHPYHTRCDRDTMSQRTCEEPISYPLGYTCGWSRCDCNGDLLLDTTTQHCVPIESCPAVKRKKTSRQRSGRRRRKHKSSKIVVPEDVDMIDMRDIK